MAQKRIRLDHKSVIFDKVSMCLVSHQQVIPKTDKNAWNEHSLKCLTSFKVHCYLCGGSLNHKRVNWTEKSRCFVSATLCLLLNSQMNPNNWLKSIKSTLLVICDQFSDGTSSLRGTKNWSFVTMLSLV